MLNFPVQGLAHVSFDALLVQQAGSMFRSRRNALCCAHNNRRVLAPLSLMVGSETRAATRQAVLHVDSHP